MQIHIGRGTSADPAEDRAGDISAVHVGELLGARVVDDDEADERGVFRGHHADEGNDVFANVVAALRIVFLNGPRLAGHLESRDCREGGGASRFDDLFQGMAHLRGRLGGDHAVDDLRLIVFHQRSIIRHQRFDDSRFPELAVAGDRRVCASELQRRDTGRVTETSAGEIDFVAGVAGASRTLATELDAGLATETVAVEVVVKALGTELQPQLVGANVVGFLKYSFKG